MQAITVRDRDAGAGGLSLTDMPYPHAAENDVIVRVHAAGFTSGELGWPATWTDHAGRDRTPSVPGHDMSGVVAELGYGTTSLTVGQRVFGLADWARLTTGQTVLSHGAAGGVGSIAVQLARDAGGRIIGTGRAADRDTALGLDLARRLREGRLRPIIGAIRTLPEALAAFAPGHRTRGKTIIQVTGG